MDFRKNVNDNCIVLAKERLEELKKHYYTCYIKFEYKEFGSAFYLGKYEMVVDMLKALEEEDQL